MMTSTNATRLGLAAAVVLLAVASTACGKEYVRDTQDPSIDNAAMSTGLDKDDIQRMLADNLNNLRGAPIMNQWRQDRGQDIVAIFPFINETSEHIDSSLSAILSEAETWLTDSQAVTVVSQERQRAMIGEVEQQQNAVFNPAHIAQYGKQLGVKYYLTGKVQTADERTSSARRVQYFLFMQVLSVETGEILFQNKTGLTKAII
jgi:penicillin-binding protein activator